MMILRPTLRAGISPRWIAMYASFPADAQQESRLRHGECQALGRPHLWQASGLIRTLRGQVDDRAAPVIAPVFHFERSPADRPLRWPAHSSIP
jgi:hypothetical protein